MSQKEESSEIKSTFDDFIKEDTHLTRGEINWEQKKNIWITRLKKLHSDIQEMLKEYVEKGFIDISFEEKTIREEYIGLYNVDIMKLFFKGNTIIIDPIGTLLIGCQGRVDVISKESGNIERIVLVEEKDQGSFFKVTIIENDEPQEKVEKESGKNIVWKIASRPPKIRYSDLNQDNFLELLLKVING